MAITVGMIFYLFQLYLHDHCSISFFRYFFQGVIFSAVFSSKGDQLLSVSDDRTIRRWNIEREECLQILYGHKARVWDAALLEDVIISIGEDATCIVWDKDSSIIKKIKGHKGNYSSLKLLLRFHRN